MESTSGIKVPLGTPAVVGDSKHVNGVDLSIWGHQQRPKMSGVVVDEVPGDQVSLKLEGKDWVFVDRLTSEESQSIIERDVSSAELDSAPEFIALRMGEASEYWKIIKDHSYENIHELCEYLLDAEDEVFRNSLMRMLYETACRESENKGVYAAFRSLSGYISSLDESQLQTGVRDQLLGKMKNAFITTINTDLATQHFDIPFTQDDLTQFVMNVGGGLLSGNLLSRAREEFWEYFAANGHIDFILSESGKPFWKSSSEPFFESLMGKSEGGKAVIPAQLLNSCSARLSEMIRRAGHHSNSDQYRDRLLLELAHVSHECIVGAIKVVSEYFSSESCSAPPYKIKVGKDEDGTVLKVNEQSDGKLGVSFFFNFEHTRAANLAEGKTIAISKAFQCMLTAQFDASEGYKFEFKSGRVKAME